MALARVRATIHLGDWAISITHFYGRALFRALLFYAFKIILGVETVGTFEQTNS
jgi:hypothetical protein